MLYNIIRKEDFMKETTTQRLNQLISESGLRQVEILEKSKPYQKELDVKMGKSALSQYISGKSNPDQDKLVLLAKTFGVSEAWLLGFDVPKEPFGNNIVHGDNNGVNGLTGGSGNTNTYNFGGDCKKQEAHNSNMHDMSRADLKLQRLIANKIEKQIKVEQQISDKLDKVADKLDEIIKFLEK